MSSLVKDDRSGNWLVMFRWNGRQFRRSCETKSEVEAGDVKARVDQTTRLLKQGVLEMPDDADPATWIMTGGKLARRIKGQRAGLVSICDDYLKDQKSKAESTLAGETIHLGHLKRNLGDVDLARIDLRRIQDYVAKRNVSGTTIRKELVTFRQVWDWARDHGLTKRDCPIYNDRRKWAVKIPKPAEKERFQTWGQIEARIVDGASESLWECLFLDQDQVTKLLSCVRQHARHPFIYPMFAFAAYTGARRSEILRSEREDFDFAAGQVRIREQKRRRSKSQSFRFVPMHGKLREAMEEGLDGRWTISNDGTRMSPHVAHHHFKKTLEDSKWKVIRGFHVLRHSFGSNLACKGVPRETIAAWMGHSTQEMMSLYQHLFPQDWGSQISVLD